jgi:hypothetical protein
MREGDGARSIVGGFSPGQGAPDQKKQQRSEKEADESARQAALEDLIGSFSQHATPDRQQQRSTNRILNRSQACSRDPADNQ